MTDAGQVLSEKLLDIYGDGGDYFAKHSGDVGIAVITVLTFSLVVGYLQTLNNLKALRKDFHNIRCDPSIMPFAGVIAAPEGVAQMDFTAENFEGCTKKILTSVADKAFDPVDKIMGVFTSAFGGMTDAMASMMSFFDYLRSMVSDIPVKLYGMLLNVLVPLRRVMRTTEDVIGRIMGNMGLTLKLMEGTMLQMQSVLNMIIEFVIGILIAMAALILAFFALAFFPPFAVLAKALVIVMVAFVALLLPIILLLMSVFGSFNDGQKVPKVPKCFHPSTKVRTSDGREVLISELKLGDTLMGDSVVQAKMRLSNIDEVGRYREKLFDIRGSETTVSGSHLVYDPWSNNFISVAEASKLDRFGLEESKKTSEELICLITSNHIIKIGGQIFHDWEDNNGSASKSL